MSLGLSQIGSEISTGEDQNQPAADILRLGSAKTRQFDNVIGSSMGSVFRPSQTVGSSTFFRSEADQDYSQENHSPHGLLGSKPLNSLVQLADLQNSATSSSASSIFNFSFFPSSSNSNDNDNNTRNISSSLFFPNLFNYGHHHASGSGNEGSNLFSDNLIGENLNSAMPSLYSSSMQNHTVSPHLSATALLQKAAQLGSMASNTRGTLLKTFGSGSSSGTKSDHNPLNSTPFGSTFGDHNNGSHMNDLVTSFAGSSSFTFRGGLNNYGGPPQENDYGYNATKFSFDEPSLKHRCPSFSSMEQAKLQQNLGVGLGGPDGLTRDFLGVGPAGELVRSMSGGCGQREHGMESSSSDSETKTAPKSPSFGGEVNFQRS